MLDPDCASLLAARATATATAAMRLLFVLLPLPLGRQLLGHQCCLLLPPRPLLRLLVLLFCCFLPFPSLPFSSRFRSPWTNKCYYGYDSTTAAA